MNVKAFALVSVGSLAFAAAAPAAISGDGVVTLESNDGVNDVWRVWVISDDAADQMLAVNGDANVSPLIFTADSALVNDGNMYAQSDRLRPANQGSDSYVALGDSVAAGNVSFSPNFLGYTGAYGPRAIVGSFFSQADNGGYFDSNPTTEVNPLEGRILIAQFILAEGSTFTYSGTVSYNDAAGTLTNVRFSASNVPAPGALALLGLAGIVGSRRRR